MHRRLWGTCYLWSCSFTRCLYTVGGAHKFVSGYLDKICYIKKIFLIPIIKSILIVVQFKHIVFVKYNTLGSYTSLSDIWCLLLNVWMSKWNDIIQKNVYKHRIVIYKNIGRHYIWKKKKGQEIILEMCVGSLNHFRLL